MKRKMLSMLMAAVMMVSLTACGSSASTTAESSGTEAAAETEESADSTEGSASEATGETYKIGLVQFVDDASLNQIREAVIAELKAKEADCGVTFEILESNGQADSTVLNQIATDLIEDKVDMIIPIATPAAMIMQAATEDNQIPVVFSAVTDPVSAGLVSSLDAPGANITGTSDALNTNAVFDLMFAANPDIKKVGLLYNKSEDASKRAIEEAKAYAKAKGVTIIEKTGTTNDEVVLAADALVAEGVDAVFTPTDNTIMTAELSIFEKFIDAGIPHYAGADSFALNGAFCGYGVNYVDLGTATADLAIDILANGADPASTPVVTMDNGIATVNTETAEAIKLDYSMFADMCTELKETITAENFE